MCRGARQRARYSECWARRRAPLPPPHHRIQNHEKRLLLLRLGLLNDRDRLPDAEALVQLVGGVRGGDDDLPRRQALLARVADELLPVHARHLQVDDEEVDRGIDLRQRVVGMAIRLDVNVLGVALGDEVRPEVAVGRRVVDDDDALHRSEREPSVRRENFTTPPTTVATARPRRVCPMNGEFEALEWNGGLTSNDACRSKSATSPGDPFFSVPPGSRNVRAGPQLIRSTSRPRSITFLRTSRS